MKYLITLSLVATILVIGTHAREVVTENSADPAFKTLVISGHFEDTIGGVYVRDIYGYSSPNSPISTFEGGLPAGDDSDPYNWCEALRLQEFYGWIYVMGNMGCTPYKQPSPLYFRGVARTNGKEWQDLDHGVARRLFNRSEVDVVDVDENGVVYAGGWFPDATAYSIKKKLDVNVSYIAMWTEADGWSSMNAEQLRPVISMVRMNDVLFVGLDGAFYGSEPSYVPHAGIAYTWLGKGAINNYVWEKIPGFTPLQTEKVEILCQPGQTGCYPCPSFPSYNCTTIWDDDTAVSVLLGLPSYQLLVLGGTWKWVPTAHPDDPMTAFNVKSGEWIDMNFTQSGLTRVPSCGACTPCVLDSKENVYCTDGQHFARWSPVDREWLQLAQANSTATVYRFKYLRATDTLFAFDQKFVYTLAVPGLTSTTQWQRVPFSFNPNNVFLHDFLPTSNAYFTLNTNNKL